MPPTFYLIDGHALAYRMYFALTAGSNTQRWQTSKGEPTAGVYGFARELLRILEQEKPEYLAVAFDVGKTFRDEIFPSYKGTRAKMPDDLRTQIERIREMVDVFNIPRLEMDGYEADDVLGSIANIAAKEGMGTKIITGDRDLLQLVGKRIAVYLAGDEQNYVTDEDVIRKLGVRPDQVVDYKAIVGDKSDNIPGVPGVGEKTAVSLLEKFGTLDNIYKNIDKVENRWKTKLEQGKDSAYLSYDLARIRIDLPVKLDLEKAKAHDFDAGKIEAFFLDMEFRTLIKTLDRLTGKESSPQAESPTRKGRTGQLSMFVNQPQAVNVTLPASSIQVKIIDTTEKLNGLVKELAKAEVISFDTETTSTEEMQANIVGISLATKPGVGYYIPVGHLAGNNLPIEQTISALRASMTNPKIPKIAHNAKYDAIVLSRVGLVVSPIAFDTMIAEFLVDPASHNFGLKTLAFTKLGEEMTHIEQLIGTGKHQLSMAEVAIESVASYAAADAETTLRLMPVLQQELKRVQGEKLMRDIEMPLIAVLADMEMTGVLLDLPFFKK